jgi:alcohol dehydrogenase
VQAVRRILAELEFPTAAAAGVSADDLDDLTEAALEDYFISVAPAPWSPAEVRAAYEQGLALGDRR